MNRCNFRSVSLVFLASSWLAASGGMAENQSGGREGDKLQSLKDLPNSQLRMLLKGYPGDWRTDTDQYKGVDEPPRRKPISKAAVHIDLSGAQSFESFNIPLTKALKKRRSRREYSDGYLSLEALSYLLWSAHGVTETIAQGGGGRTFSLRTAPSAGGRYPLELYLVIHRVTAVSRGVYRYLPDTHQLALVRPMDEVSPGPADASYGQLFVREAAVVLVWAAVPARTEWRYGYISHRMIAIEAGHVCQNVYLACEAIGAGVCAVLSYDQVAMDALIGVDGVDEFTLYVATVGLQRK